MQQIIQLYRNSFAGLSLQVWYMALMMLVNRMGSLIFPFLTLYVTQELGWSLVESGVASSAFGLGGMLGSYLGGVLVDKIGYFKVIIIGQLGAAFAFFSLQFITSFYPLCLALFLSSTIADILRPGVMTGATSISNKETKTRAISLLRMSFNLGLAIGPAFAGLIIAATSYRAIFILDGLTCLSAAIFGYFMIQRTVDDTLDEDNGVFELKNVRKSSSPYTDIPFILFMACAWIMLIAFFQLLFTVPVFMKEELGLHETDVGLFFGINGILIFLSEMPIVYFTERKWRLMPAMIVGSLMIGVSYLFLIPDWMPWALIGTYALFISYGEIINFPFITSLSLRRASGGNTGQYLGIQSMLFSFSLIVSPLTGTRIVASYGYSTLWITCAVLCVVAAVGWYFLDDEFKLKEE